MQSIVNRFAEALRWIDESGAPFKNFQPGVGPYSEPQVVKKSLEYLKNRHPDEFCNAKTKRNPDVFIPNSWALEFKIVRPFGDNGKEAEHWSQNLLHPYPGNMSSIGDIYKLISHNGIERKGIIVLAYEHDPPQIDLGIIIDCFERLVMDVLDLPLGKRCFTNLKNLIHPIHQQAKIFGWEVLLE